jgi:hypothetical protein
VCSREELEVPFSTEKKGNIREPNALLVFLLIMCGLYQAAVLERANNRTFEVSLLRGFEVCL